MERECARKRRDRGHRTRSSHADEEEIESRAAFGRQDQASEAEGDEKGQVRTCGFDRLVSGDQKSGGAEASVGLAARQLARPYFVQMKGLMRITGRVNGRRISGEGAGFFETYR